jgi:hypothetical protein
MKSKINSPDESCFNFPTGYSIDMSVSVSIPLGAASFLFSGTNNWGSANNWWNNFQSGSLITFVSSFFNKIS